MPGILDAVDSLTARLAPTGLRVVADPRDVNAPCVLLAAPVLRYRFGGPSVDVEWTVWLLTVGAGRRAALAALDELLATVSTALACVVEARPDDWTSPDGGEPLPGYVLTWTERLRT